MNNINTYFLQKNICEIEAFWVYKFQLQIHNGCKYNPHGMNTISWIDTLIIALVKW